MGEWLYKTCLALLAIVIVSGGLGDLDLFLHGGAAATITDWLRHNPEWYWGPATLMLAFLVGLGVHLFVVPRLFR